MAGQMLKVRLKIVFTPRSITAFTLVCASAMLVACAQSPGPASVPNQVAARDTSVDFSGSWEMDYGHSDNVDDRLRSIYAELQRAAERRARNQGSDSRSRSMGSYEGQSMTSIVALARMADYITTSQILNVEQSDIDILVEREDNFALSCTFVDDTPEPVIDELGSELCGWDAHQLVFLISMPDGLRVNHRMSLAPDGQKLHIATTVSNKSNTSPFVLNRVYYRFDAMQPDYECKYTLSKGNVCSWGGT